MKPPPPARAPESLCTYITAAGHLEAVRDEARLSSHYTLMIYCTGAHPIAQS